MTSVVCSLLVPNSMLTGRGWVDDYSVFAYIGWLMQRGYIPYRDVWDHKGPLLYDLNFIGWNITPQSTVGIGLLQALALAVCFFVVLWIVTSIAPFRVLWPTALFSLAFASVTARGGNMTESWAVAASALAIATLFRAAGHIPVWWHSLLIATALVASFWLRPNLCVTPAIALVALLYRAHKTRGWTKTLQLLVFAFIVGAIESAALLFPIWKHGALQELCRAYFVYNSNYSHLIATHERLWGTLALVLVIMDLALPAAAALGWAVVFQSVLKRTSKQSLFQPVFGAFLVVALPLETLACLISGRPYLHYWLPLWPVLTILSGVGLAWAFGRTERWPKSARLFLLCLIALLQIQKLLNKEAEAFTPQREQLAVAEYIRRITTSEERILPVGDFRAVLIALDARRLPATRYIYQLALEHRANAEAASQTALFWEDIGKHPPTVIFSMPGMVGSLCRGVALDKDYIGSAKVDGYNYGALPRQLAPELAAHYRLVTDPSFPDACVYVQREHVH